MNDRVNFGLVGVGGFADNYMQNITKLCEKGRAVLKAVTVRSPHKYQKELADLSGKGVKVYKRYDEMLQQEHGKIDIMAIPTSIHSHKDLAIDAMQSGFNVLVEKPPAATIQEVDDMNRVSKETGRFCVIGFQWISSTALKQLKELINDGKLGSIKVLLGKGVSKRLDSYYARANWAGKIKCEGKWVLDGSISNPLSHYLNNLLFLSGSLSPLKVRAELYKGHDIEGEDTACLEVVLENGVKLYFYSTLCAEKEKPAFFKIIASRGEVKWQVGEDILIEYYDGRTEKIENKKDLSQMLFENLADYVQGLRKDLDCPVELTRPFTLVMNGAYESAGKIVKIPQNEIVRIQENDSAATHIKDIEAIIDRAWEKRCLFSDLSVDWACKSSYFDLEGYCDFHWQEV